MARKKKRVGGRFGAFISVISTTLVLILLGADVFFVTVASNFSKNLREITFRNTTSISCKKT